MVTVLKANDPDIDNQRIHASEMRNAILSLQEIIGRSFAETLVEALEESGIDLSGSRRYSLHQIKNGLASIFGDEVTELLMPKIRKNLMTQRQTT